MNHVTTIPDGTIVKFVGGPIDGENRWVANEVERYRVFHRVPGTNVILYGYERQVINGEEVMV